MNGVKDKEHFEHLLGYLGSSVDWLCG